MAGTLKYAFRITHIDNIPHIIQYGLVRADSPNRNPDYVSIGDTQVIHLRGENGEGLQAERLCAFLPWAAFPYAVCDSARIQRGEKGGAGEDCVLRGKAG